METRLTDATLARSAGPESPLRRLLALPPRQLAALVIGAVVLLAALGWTLSAGREQPYRVLFANFTDKDGGAVIAALATMGVPHRFSEGGAAILVPADKVHEVRLRLASQGLPKGGTVGFELVENQRFGATQFQERLNFQRGLEGELARSIMALSAVQSARVHLALPNQSAFLREAQKPSASVLLTLYGGRTLDRAQVAGIVHLVASSVPELQTRAVSVIDQTGALLSQAPGENGPGALDGSQLQYVRQAEQALTQRILAMLEPIVGPGNVRAQVTADIDFTQSESTAETYGPNQNGAPAAVRSQQLSEAPGAGGGSGVGGSPGALANQPPAAAASPVNGQAQAVAPPPVTAPAMRRDAVTNYEVDKTVKVVRNASGTVRRLSAAVLVNHVAGPGGKPVGMSPQQLEQVQALVREAIGFSRDRGDSLQVVQTPFTVPPNGATPADVPLWRDPELWQLARTFAPWVVFPLVALVVLLAVVRPAIRAARPPRGPLVHATAEDPIELAPPAPPGELPLPVANADADDPGLPSPPAMPPLLGGMARDEVREARLEAIRQMARQDPATVAGVVRKWAGQGA